jgi:hypothetical protein
MPEVVVRLPSEPLAPSTARTLRRLERLLLITVILMIPAVLGVSSWDRLLGEILAGLWLILTVEILLVVWWWRSVERKRGAA